MKNTTTTNAAAIADRSFKMAECIRKLQHEDDSLSFDAAYTKFRNSTEGKALLATMHQPVAMTGPDPAVVAERKIAAARFSGRVQEAMQARGINFGAAWAALKVEEPKLFAAMGVGGNPVNAPEAHVVAADPATAKQLSETFDLGTPGFRSR